MSGVPTMVQLYTGGNTPSGFPPPGLCSHCKVTGARVPMTTFDVNGTIRYSEAPRKLQSPSSSNGVISQFSAIPDTESCR
ncbi:unnamed protein product [Cyprideis torosa]|uniref:Uncharacterized protein n=1 Tax=Cyprideis torosa TaxID=163714 RepID=A0A7R8ZL18_9CRUS|nr:unnamed protein product [Cyprideis torosa]CAG0882693.1 unnamed protein product [Cyprideis torosa]